MINFCFRVYRKLVYPAHKSFLSVVFFVVIAAAGFTVSFSSARAEGYPKYGPNETVIVGEFIYNDDFEPATSSCSIIIQNTAGVVVVPTTTLTTSTNGWQSYTFGATSTQGTWPTTIVCGSVAGGDLAKLDKTFIIGNTAISTSSIASSVWSSAVRTLTSGVSIADDIWAASSRTLTSFGSIVSDIWNNPTRTLTSFGTLLADIWSDVASPNRRLTSGSLTDGGVLASEAFVTSTIQSATSSIISEVIANRSLINALNNISAADVWSHSGRTLTDYATSSISASIWTVPTSTFSQFGSIGNLIASNLDAQISSRGTSTLSAADVWNAATRSLTDYSTSSIALGVWANSARTLTSYGNDITAADVWNALTSTLNTAGSIGKQLVDNINVSSSLLFNKIIENQALISGLNNISAADVWTYATRTVSSSVEFSTSSLASIWSIGTSTLSSFGSIGKLVVDNLDAQVSSRGMSSLTATDVWQAATRSLTDYATSSIVTAIWSTPTSSLTTAGSIGRQLAENTTVSSSRVYDEVIANRVLINALNDISAADVWSYGSRSITGEVTLATSSREAVWSVATSALSTMGSIGKLVVDNLDTQVSTRGVSNLTAADVWVSANRTLSDYATSSITTAIWSNAARTLTNYGNDITAADVWNSLSSGLNTVGSIGKQLAENTAVSTTRLLDELLVNRALVNALNDISAADVWGYTDRSLTGFVDITTSSRIAIWSTPTSSLTTAGSIGRQLAENTTVSSSRVYDEVIANRVLINALNDISAADVWSYGSRSITGEVTLATSSREAVWSVATSALSTMGSIGKLVVDNLDTQVSTRGVSNLTAADVWVSANRTLSDYATSSITTAIWSNAARTLTNYGNDITAADVWNVLSSGLTTVDSIGKQLAENVDTGISTRGTSNLTATDVWQSGTRSLTDYSTSTIASAVWSNAARTLTSYGNDITAADVWNVMSSGLTTVGSIGNQLAENTTVSSSRLLDELLVNRTLINSLNNISAADVWTYANRTVTSSVEFATSSLEALWSVATSTLTSFGTIGKLIVDNLDAEVSSRGVSDLTASDVWQSATRSLTDYSTSTIVSAVWSNASRTLTNYGNDVTAADVWNVMTSTLSTIGSIGAQLTTNIDTAISTRAASVSEDASWTVRMSDVDSVSAGKTYRTKVYLFDSQSVPTNPASVPEISLYDASRNVVVSGVAMSAVSTGIYEYTYSVANNAEGGLWEAVIETEVESGKIIETNDYWLVAASPAQVLINSMTDTLGPSVAANVTITNEGLSGYEYQYEWCIVTSVDNPCGGGNDTYHATAAKFINPGEDFNTTLTGTITGAGSYYFKLVVYFGTESSGASRSFTATYTTPPAPGGGGGGGGGGGVFIPPTTPVVTPTTTPVGVCTGADFNHDNKVNSIDFSILLAFWKTSPPFRNPCVDVNVDTKVDSVDFSILMYNWGKNN